MGDLDQQTIIRDGGCTVIVDIQYWPVVFATWFGEATEAVVRQHLAVTEKLLARARTQHERYLSISDAAFSERPNAKVRKALADQMKTRAKDVKELEIANLVIIENALIRSVMTALTWLAPQMIEVEIVGDLGSAIERALHLLDRERIAHPRGLSVAQYRRPTPEAPRSAPARR